MDEGENEAQSRHINTQMCMCVRQNFGKMINWISKKKTLFCYSRLMEKHVKVIFKQSTDQTFSSCAVIENK